MIRQTGRSQKKYFLSFLTVLVVSLVSWSAVHSEEALSITKEKGHPKIESALFEMQQKYLLHGKEGSQIFARQHRLQMDAQDKITVFILPKADETKDAIDVEALKAFGGEVVKSGDTTIKAKVPILLLDQIADHVKGVNFIKRPDRPHIEAIASEGVALTGASLYQASGYTGSGVRVAVIDLGFAGLSDAIAAGVLPSSVIPVDCAGGECTPTNFALEEEPHGTAVAEIVHEMAPGAQLYLIKVGDGLDLKSAKDYCIANGIRVINHSVGWFISNFYDGTCWFDNSVCIADHAYKNGILWVNAMGNAAMRHYEATFSDSDGDRLHNVTPGSNFISLHAGEGDPIIALLTWDAWPATSQDYDLLLFDSSLNMVASSISVQNGSQPPQEEVVYVTPAAGTYYLAVKNASATSNLRFSIFTFYHDLDPHVASSSLASPADAAGVMTVAAVNYAHWSTGPQESFSSQGPTTDGRMKPEISGPDGNSSFIYPPPEGFLGTSAASPHVAGAAALILSNNPTFTVSQLWNFLTSTAIDMGSPGWDPIFGYGRVNLSTIFVDPATVDFGDVLLGRFAEKTITVRNVGNPNLVIGTVSGAPVPFAILSDSCSGRSLPLAGSCTFKVRFSPSSTGNFNGAVTIPSNDPFESALAVPVKGKGILAINLSMPNNQFSIDPCSFKVPLAFEWEVPVAFPNYELQFSPDPGFGLIPVKIQITGVPIYVMNPLQLKKILLIPGAGGGLVYWRVVGTSSNGDQSTSARRSILVPEPQPVVDPVIAPVTRSLLPTLTWENQCSYKFRVWFRNDPGSFAARSVFYSVSDPGEEESSFSRELSPTQWRGIRMLVHDQPGSPIFWYVESWDGAGRKATTETMVFILEE